MPSHTLMAESAVFDFAGIFGSSFWVGVAGFGSPIPLYRCPPLQFWANVKLQDEVGLTNPTSTARRAPVPPTQVRRFWPVRISPLRAGFPHQVGGNAMPDWILFTIGAVAVLTSLGVICLIMCTH